MIRKIAIYTSPLTIPLALILIARIAALAAGFAWNDDAAGFVLAVSLTIGLPVAWVIVGSEVFDS